MVGWLVGLSVQTENSLLFSVELLDPQKCLQATLFGSCERFILPAGESTKFLLFSVDLICLLFVLFVCLFVCFVCFLKVLFSHLPPVMR